MIRIERKYKKMIDYLICDVENDDKEDLKQDLLLKLITLLNSKKKKIINNDNYIFIALKNEKNSKLKHYNHKFLSLENFAEDQISIKYEDEYDYLFQLFISNLQFFWSKLNMKEKIIVFNYYFKCTDKCIKGTLGNSNYFSLIALAVKFWGHFYLFYGYCVAI